MTFGSIFFENLNFFSILKFIFRKFFRFFDGVAIFKGLKSHDAGAGGTKVWYQNVRKDVGYNSMSKDRLEGFGAKPSGQFCKK